MTSVFWDVHENFFIDYLQKGKTRKLDSEYYANILQHLSNEVQKQWLHFAKKKVLFHCVCTSSCIHHYDTEINKLQFELLSLTHSYSPDLAPFDYFLF